MQAGILLRRDPTSLVCDLECGSFGIRIQVKNKAPSQFEKEPKMKLSTQSEDHIDRGLHLDGLVVEQVRPVAPAPHGIQGRLLQHGGTADDVEVLNRSLLGNGCLQSRPSRKRAPPWRSADRSACVFWINMPAATPAEMLTFLGGAALHLGAGSATEHAAHHAACAAAQAFHAGHTKRTRRRFLLRDHLDVVRNLGRCGQLVVHHLRLNMHDVHDLRRRRRRRWWWRRRGRNQQGLPS